MDRFCSYPMGPKNESCGLILDRLNTTKYCPVHVQNVRNARSDESDSGIPVDSPHAAQFNPPVIVNAKGGKQHKVYGRYNLVSPLAMERVANILENGSINYGPWNWHKIDSMDHINHAIAHIFKYIQGDESEDHLGNAFCRMMFAVDRQMVEDKYQAPYDNTHPEPPREKVPGEEILDPTSTIGYVLNSLSAARITEDEAERLITHIKSRVR